MQRDDAFVLLGVSEGIDRIATRLDEGYLLLQQFSELQDIPVAGAEIFFAAINYSALGIPHHEILAAVVVEQRPVGHPAID